MPGLLFRRISCVYILIVAISLTSCRDRSPNSPPTKTTASQADYEALRPAVQKFCGDCHANPPPDSFPQDAWYAEVEQGYRFYFESGRTDLKPPQQAEVVSFFRAHAPEKLPAAPKPTPLTAAGSFRKEVLHQASTAPAISFLDSTDSKSSGRIWLCDMHSGGISYLDRKGAELSIQEVAPLANPAHLATCDLDSDGKQDLVIADLGSFVPGDHENGKIWWLPGGAETDAEKTPPRILLENVGRIADVRPADFDGNGRLDFVVAEFGWRKSGSIFVLLQREPSAEGPQFERIVIDSRHGTIHTPVCDLNGDGRPDFIALVSQEHEVVDGFLNLGEGKFEKHRIYSANDPAFGSSGIELVDLDRDDDLDVLLTNGDTLDSHYLKPSHGITWIENQGNLKFQPRRLAAMPGAMRAIPCDLDGDGDLDVIAAAFLPASLRAQQSPESNETLIWLEQTQPGEFERRTLEVGDAGHMTVLADDFDGDGDPDLLVPNYAEQRTVEMSPLTIWWNELPQKVRH